MRPSGPRPTGEIRFARRMACTPDGCATSHCALTVELDQGAPTPGPLGISGGGCGRVRPGDLAFCFLFVQGTDRAPLADRSAFGGSTADYISRCPACGSGPVDYYYDLDVRVPLDMAPGVKPVPVWVTDGQGHRADAIWFIEIVR